MAISLVEIWLFDLNIIECAINRIVRLCVAAKQNLNRVTLTINELMGASLSSSQSNRQIFIKFDLLNQNASAVHINVRWAVYESVLFKF